MATDDLIRGQITDESLELMRRRIGYPNPTLRAGIHGGAWNEIATADAVRRWSLCIGDDNPFFIDRDYGRNTRWGDTIAPTCFEKSMGIIQTREVPPELDDTRKALRGVQLFHSGGENYYFKPIKEGVKLYRDKWVENVEPKESQFAGRSAIVTNRLELWDEDDVVYSKGVEWFVHAERRKRQVNKSVSNKPSSRDIYEPPFYTDEDLAEIEAAYETEYVRGMDTLYFEDVEVGQPMPRMVKGPLTITDLINFHMGAGWLIYGLWPYKLAYKNRKALRGFYTRNKHNAWDALQRVHWDPDLAREVGLPDIYDIGPLRQTMVSHYLHNFAGDDSWIYRIRYEFRNFNYMGDVTWLTGEIIGKHIDPILGPLIEMNIVGTNQRGKENIRGSATILVASRQMGLCKLPQPPARGA